MNCLECKGACCESFALPKASLPLALGREAADPDTRRWLELHATQDWEPEYVSLECRCTMLGADGLCKTYDTRPLMCRVFAPGCRECLETVRLRRTPEQYAAIREAGDPERVHAA